MRISRGLNVRVGGPPRQAVSADVPVPLVGFFGSDYPDLRAELLVAEGDRVARGTPLLRDRKRPEIRIVAPVAGIVDEISLGQRRRLSTVAIRPEGDEAVSFRHHDTLDRDTLRALLLEAGLWPALTARPFGHVADPARDPDALFVTATDTAPGAPDPRLVIGNAPDSFREGIHALRHLTQAPIHICQPPGEPFVHPGGHVRVVHVSGPHPAGLAGTQIDRVRAVSHGGTVWQIGYQDVLAIGALRLTGTLDLTRTVSVSGPLARDPRLLQLPAGAEIDRLAAAEAMPGPRRALSGSVLGGRESRFLRRGATQITLLPRTEAPLRRRRWLPEPRRLLRRAAVVPHVALDLALGPAVPAVPLIRALSVGDAAEADRLGVRALLEEDMALLTYLTGGAEDFAVLLREVLDRLEVGA